MNEIATERLKDGLKYRQGNGLPPSKRETTVFDI